MECKKFQSTYRRRYKWSLSIHKADEIISHHNEKQDVSQKNLQLKRLSRASTDKVDDKWEFSHKLQLNTKQSKSLDKLFL